MARATDSDAGLRAFDAARPRGQAIPSIETYVGWVVVCVAVAWATWARWTIVRSGPPLDTDAYAHAIMARRMLDNWRDVRVHWVWLPLWHAIGAISARFGGGLAAIRSIGVILSGVGPILLTSLLSTSLRRDGVEPGWKRAAERTIPFTAGALLAIWPLCVSAGASGQPEPLFQCLVLAACLTWERERPVTTGMILSAAVLLRYEAWILIGVFGCLWLPRSRRTFAGAFAWWLPAIAIGWWCAIHASQTHEWFQFIRLNRAFAHDALSSLHLTFDKGGVPLSLTRYTIAVPFLSIGPAILLAVPGTMWVVRRSPRALAAAGGALLAFITYAWAMRQMLGLQRHFIVVAPLYATAVAAGLCVTVGWIANRAGVRSKTVVPIAAMSLIAAIVGASTLPALRRERVISRHAFESERRAAAALAALPHGDIAVFCDQPAVEILSGLPSSAFLRWSVRDVRPYNFDVECRRHRLAVAVSLPENVRAIRGEGVVVFEDARIVVLARQRADSPGEPIR